MALDKRAIVWYIVVMKLKRDDREMLELVAIVVAAAMATPILIFILAVLLAY